jgi:hypothetical protein
MQHPPSFEQLVAMSQCWQLLAVLVVLLLVLLLLVLQLVVLMLPFARLAQMQLLAKQLVQPLEEPLQVQQLMKMTQEAQAN